MLCIFVGGDCIGVCYGFVGYRQNVDGHLCCLNLNVDECCIYFRF